MTAPTELDDLTVTVVVDNATDTLSSIPPGAPQLPEMAYLLGRPAIGQHEGHDLVQAFDQLCVACHGFSVLATARRGDISSTVLFDVGPYGEVWLANAQRLQIDLAAIEVLFLSHWHWDHSGGLPPVVSAIAAARRGAGRPPLVVDVHPDRPDQRGVLTPFGSFAMLPPEPTLDALEAAGAHVVTDRDRHTLGSGLFLSSGDIPRKTTYETGLDGHHTWRAGQVTPDPDIHDERFLAATVRGRGTTVLSACSHAGIVNVGLEALSLTPDQPIDLLLGGYHLAGAAVEDRIDATVRDLAALVAPRMTAPGHCTGWRAAAALAAALGPTGFAPSVVGTRYLLSAPG
jgi:7,8-dihydropterin-6-yl-methyl-4-(beta-D-ribofuranosyl)aminobenzene 5'-phosphate synthase